jgi:hypothetical protein
MPQNLAPTKSLTEEAFSVVPGKFGRGKLGNPQSVATSPDRGEKIVETELGAVVRPGSSSPARRRPGYKTPAAAPESSQFEAGEVPRSYRPDGR